MSILFKVLNRLFKHRVITDCITRDPYLYRWFLFRTKRIGIFLHCFVRSDYERALHDHPWNFLVIPIWRGYIEHQERRVKHHSHQWNADGERCERCGAKDWMDSASCVTYEANKARVLPILGTRMRFAEWKHRVELLKAKPTMTVAQWVTLMQEREYCESTINAYEDPNKVRVIEATARIREIDHETRNEPYVMDDFGKVTVKELPSWSLFIRLRERRTWGFWLPEGFKKWNVFERERCQ